MSATILQRLASLLPRERVLVQPEQLAAYESDGLTAFHERPLAVAVPESAEEVVALLRFCRNERVPFVARGSGTSLSGGSLPVPGGIVIALNRLNRILKLDPAQRIVGGYFASRICWISWARARIAAGSPSGSRIRADNSTQDLFCLNTDSR